jgi:hypothetical protein
MTSPYYGAFVAVYVIVAVGYLGYVASLVIRSRRVMDAIRELEQRGAPRG